MKNTKPKRGYKSYESALNGIANYQQKYKPELIKVKDPNQYFSKLSHLIRKFLKESTLPCIDNGSYKALDINSNTIQDNFTQFKNWLKTQ